MQSDIERTLAQLEKEGAILKEISLPHISYAVSSYYNHATAEASSYLSVLMASVMVIEPQRFISYSFICQIRSEGFW
jgi:Asp-tRNA(Asn)/Glu-tRNA(Gln) amidotransferase A subunit family amidase